MKNDKPKDKKKGRFMKGMLLVNLILATSYTTASLFILYKTGIESPSLTTGVFAYIGSSGGMMAFIKNSKIKNSETKNQTETVKEDTAG